MTEPRFSRQPVPMPENSFADEISPNIQSSCVNFLAQIRAIFSCSITCYIVEKGPTPTLPKIELMHFRW